MTDREIGEIRRRFKREKTSISRIRGCLVNENKEIISCVDQSLGLMSETEGDQILSLLRKTLSGGMGINLMGIDFSTSQVSGGEEHALLMKLRDTQLSDEESVKSLYAKIIGALTLEGSYMILLAADTYDVFSYTKDGQKSEDAAEVFRYIICAVCPIQSTKPALSYQVKECCFRNLLPDAVISSPQVGFMFPAFDNRATNLYGALYYTKAKDNNYDTFAKALFHTERLPMPAKEQTETFKGIFADSTGESCSLQVIQSVHAQLCHVVEDHKEHKDEPLVVDKYAIRDMLEFCGIPEAGVETFEKQFDDNFGIDAQVNPKNMMDVKKFEVRTPDVVIKVSPEKRDLVETRVIDGVRYILIRADEGAEVNGIDIRMDE
ncbi:MAG: DUF4317 domain-containing protein [Ruminococcaceae bacterium]|nr:DUF4317 domain-containing protein [Oscillospiraceae bacterium]